MFTQTEHASLASLDARPSKPIPKCRVAQEPNRNRKPTEPEPPNRFPQTENRNRNRPLCEIVLKHTKTPSLEEPPDPKTATARTIPSPNRNRTEPNRGHPENGWFAGLLAKMRPFSALGLFPKDWDPGFPLENTGIPHKITQKLQFGPPKNAKHY